MTWREQTEKECPHQATNLSQLQVRALRKRKNIYNNVSVKTIWKPNRIKRSTVAGGNIKKIK